MVRKYIKPILLAITVIILLFVFLNRGTIAKNREIVEHKVSNVTENATDFHISTNGVMIFDGQKLYFCDKDVNFIKSISSKDRELEVFFDNNYAFLYDSDLKKIYEYKDTGELLNTVQLDDDLYNIKYLNKYIVLHMKNDEYEILSILNSDGSIEEIYKTPNNIMTFDIYDKSKFAVAELTIDASGYQSILNMKGYGEKSSEKFTSEGALYLYTSKHEILMVTDKNMYIYKGGEKKSIEVPNVSDVLVVGRDVYLLHSGILSKYNFNLEEKSKQILAANVDRLVQVSNSIYAYGNSDIGGELGSDSQFYTRFGYSVDKIEFFGLTIGTLRNGVVTTYKIIDKRNLNEDSKPIGVQEEKWGILVLYLNIWKKIAEN